MPTERVLVVDDDPAILILCHRILEADGYRVVDAKRGEDALTKLEQEPFDLLLTDIRLPGLNGLDVTQHLRARGIGLTVITMTGYSNMEMAIQALSLGVDEFIVKPFTPETLRVHVARALEKSRLRRENARLRTLVPLLQTATLLASGRTAEEVYSELLRAAAMLLRTHDLALLQVSRDSPNLTTLTISGNCLAALRETALPRSQLPENEGWLHQVQVWNQARSGRFPIGLQGANWMVSAPLRIHDKPLALLIAAVAAEPAPSDVEALQLVCVQAAAALENVELVSEIRRAYVKTREVEQLKSEFINIAAHELRTPLAVVVGYAALLRERLEGELEEYAGQVYTHAQRLHQIADDMLNLKYLETGRAELRLESCAVEQLVQQVVSAFRPLAAQRDQSIDIEVESQTGAVTADCAMLDLMLGSLISNAIKFSPPQSHVRVAAQGDERQVTLVVQDKGIGLEPEEAAHVFDAFYQAARSLTRQEGGLGMGLTLTREMVRAHGGKIWVESAHNHGTSFYISLPRSQNGRDSV